MPITFNCPCGKTLRVPDAHARKKAKCPVCSSVLTVPEPDPVFEVIIPPLPPDPSEGVPPAAEPEPVTLPPLPPLPTRGYVLPGFADDDDDKTPYGLAEGENDKRGPDMDSDGNPRKKDGLPNFNKGKKKFGN